MIVRAVQIDQLVADRFQSSASVVGEPLTNCRLLPPNEKLRFTISSPSHGSTPDSSRRAFKSRNRLSGKNRLDRAGLRAGADERFVGAFAEE